MRVERVVTEAQLAVQFSIADIGEPEHGAVLGAVADGEALFEGPMGMAGALIGAEIGNRHGGFHPGKGVPGRSN